MKKTAIGILAGLFVLGASTICWGQDGECNWTIEKSISRIVATSGETSREIPITPGSTGTVEIEAFLGETVTVDFKVAVDFIESIYCEVNDRVDVFDTIYGYLGFVTIPEFPEFPVLFDYSIDYGPMECGEWAYSNTAYLSTGEEDDQSSVTLVINVPCGTEPSASIGDFVWEDINQDGLQDDEPGLRCVPVYLYNCGSDGIPNTSDDVLVDSKDTDENGYYEFEDLAPGSYYVEFVAPEGYVFTQQNAGYPGNVEIDSDADPATGLTMCILLQAGESNRTIDAGLYKPLDCSGARARICRIWPPNHKYRWIKVRGVRDPYGGRVKITITSIYQDEPVDDRGDGRFAPDGKGVGTCKAWVRAERCGGRNGRVYHISFTAEDEYGNACGGEVTLGVPKSMGKRWRNPVDDGPLYDSTVACDDYFIYGKCRDKGQYHNKHKKKK